MSQPNPRELSIAPSPAELQHEMRAENPPQVVVEADQHSIRPALLLTILSVTVFAMWREPLPLLLVIGSASFLVGRIIKQLISMNSFMQHLEAWGQKVLRAIPYLQIIATLLVVLFSFILLKVACAIASGIGLFDALTIDTESYRAATENRNHLHAA